MPAMGYRQEFGGRGIILGIIVFWRLIGDMSSIDHRLGQQKQRFLMISRVSNKFTFKLNLPNKLVEFWGFGEVCWLVGCIGV